MPKSQGAIAFQHAMRSNLTKKLLHVNALLGAIGPDILGIYEPLSISQAHLASFMRNICICYKALHLSYVKTRYRNKPASKTVSVCAIAAIALPSKRPSY
ncbi:hypothetical protein [Argonema antarcticum]|uniref:hypothetical protein n=1 Tax=Argonema antarcticum TaxID=2942763 RepID=UPI002010CE9C|nr:hypothetical protein [Argonema antarcticum]MCL1472085.1 hypothetical protein [Argonema antarcticum A004/B2]